MNHPRVKVRIAVAVDEQGLWSAAGNCVYQTDEEAAEVAEDYLPLEKAERRHVVWLDAEVPLPGEGDAPELSD